MPSQRTLLKNGTILTLDPDIGNFNQANVPSDMFTQMRSVISLQHALVYDQKLSGKSSLVPDLVTTRDVLEFATIEGARANGLGEKAGTLTSGKEADIIMLRTNRINVMPINDPIGAVVWGMDTSNVDTVFVAGKALKRNGRLVGVDMDRIKKMVYASRDYVVKKSGFALPPI